MQKPDFKKELKELYNPSSKQVSIIDVPEMKFIMIDGKGSPNSEDFQKSIQVLYGVTFTIKLY